MIQTDKSHQKQGIGTLGTFGGVFTPSILTILGLILFLRMGYIVGNAGLLRALYIIAIANAISVLTTISLSAIATNLKVKGGGDYYLISRTLGPEFGGAIGSVLFLAQSVSIAFYLIGFGEAVTAILPNLSSLHAQIVAAGAVVVLFSFAWLGADWATRFQYLIMVTLFVSLVSFFIGGFTKWDVGLLHQNFSPPDDGLSFWILFAIFFPAVTGFTQGVSMSGDLKDPGKSLPKGTFMAVGLSMLVYFVAAIVFAAGLPSEELKGDSSSMNRLAHFGWMIHVGVIAATLSSAMASFLGAPRILQSLAQDRIFPFLLPFAKGSGPSENPRRGVLLSAGIALAVIALGDLNAIAPIVAMFFLISYGLLNYATYYEALAASPSFRPRFRWFHYRLSLLGALTCLGVMVAIDWIASIVAASILTAIYQYLKRTKGPSRWADSTRSYHFQRLREHLISLASDPEHPRDWRPQLLVFSKDEKRREQLLRFSSWLEGGSGLTTAVQIIEGQGAKVRKLRNEAQKKLHDHIAEQGIQAFDLTVMAPDLLSGAQILIQSHGIGTVRANTIVLNWLEQRNALFSYRGDERYGKYLTTVFRLGCNVVILDATHEEWAALKDLPKEGRRIDIWWWDDATSRLMLLLGYLMTRNEEWSDTKIRVIAAASKGSVEETLTFLKEILEEARIEAEPEVLTQVDADAIVNYSKDATLVFLPLRLKHYQPTDPFGTDPEELFNRLPIVALVLAAEDIPLDAEPEEGTAGETAQKVDAMDEAKKKAEKAEKEAQKAKKEAEEKQRKKRDTEVSEVEEDQRIKAEADAAEAEKAAEKASRKAAKARAKAEDAERDVEALDTTPEKKEDKDSNPPETKS